MDAKLIERLAREVFWQPRHVLEFPCHVAVDRSVDPALYAFAALIAEECAKEVESKRSFFVDTNQRIAARVAEVLASAIRSKFSKG